MPETTLSTSEKLALAIKLLTEIQTELGQQAGPVTKDSGGSNPPGPGQPGQP